MQVKIAKPELLNLNVFGFGFGAVSFKNARTSASVARTGFNPAIQGGCQNCRLNAATIKTTDAPI